MWRMNNMPAGGHSLEMSPHPPSTNKKSIVFVAFAHKAADEIRMVTFFKSFGVKKINELGLTCNRLTKNFAYLVTSSLRPDVAPGLPVELH
jgi:hypothetical protein